MAGKPSMRFVKAMRLVLLGESPYNASLRCGLCLSSMYRNSLYRSWRDGASKDKVREALKAEEARHKAKPKRRFRLIT